MSRGSVLLLAAVVGLSTPSAWGGDGLLAGARQRTVAACRASLSMAERTGQDAGRLATIAWRGARGVGESALEAAGALRDRLHARACAAAAAAAPHRGLSLLRPPLEAARAGEGLDAWAPLDPGQIVPERLVLLVHGLDEPGSVWKQMGPALQRQGHTVARLDYLNDQGLADSGAVLAGALGELGARGARRVDLVCHSMGGLLALDALTRPGLYGGDAGGGDRFPQVERVVMLGTPAGGSWWAHLAPLADAAEHLQRWWGSPALDPRLLLGFLCDGDGNAGRDLLPGSAYLGELFSRPAPSKVRITAVVGVLAPIGPEDVRPLAECRLTQRLAGAQGARALADGFVRAAAWLGDGVVSTDSACVPGADVVRRACDHRSMVRTIGPERAVRRWLGAPQEMPPGIAATLEALSGGTDAEVQG
jgi:hypothetical protein